MKRNKTAPVPFFGGQTASAAEKTPQTVPPETKKSRRPPKRPVFSLHWKLFFFMLLFTGAILALLWLSQVVFLDRIYQEIKIGEIEKTAGVIAGNADSEDGLALACQLAESGKFCLCVYDLNDGLLLASEDALENCTIHQILTRKTADGGLLPIPDHILQLAVAAESAGGSIFYRVTGERSIEWQDRFPHMQKEEDKEITLTPGAQLEDKESATSIIYIILTEGKDGHRVAVFLNALISPVNATVETLYTLLKVISVILIALAFLLSLFLSRVISRPIRKLTEGARILATGSYDVQFQGSGYREVAQLGDTLNYAAGELSKVDSLRRELIANVSHDLRTPLTLISGYAEMMRDIPGETKPENLQIIIDESDRLKTLVNDILDLSKLQAGSGELEKSEFDLTSAVESELCRYNKLRDREGYSIRFRYDALVTVSADRRRIMQVVYNLVNNAVNYTGADKTVLVRQTVENGAVRISVSDTGEGIDPAQLPLIFDRYYRERCTHRRAPIGTGLGLSIVKEIVTAHGGRYGVQSQVGKGSCFWFELPFLSVKMPESPDAPDVPD